MKIITEGDTKFKTYVSDIPSKEMPVFFNPVKEFDRTLSVNILKALKPRTGLDLMSASGARGLRLAKEAGIEMTFNDGNKEAVKLVKSNLKLNKLTARVYNKDANQLLYDLDEYFDFIDIDPFGSPNPFLESSINHVNRNGILAVTATDTAALNGARPPACLRKYHARVVRHPFMKETGLRVLIKHVIEKGAEQEVALKPVISHSTAHYYRAYFVKDLGALRTDELLKEIKHVYYCPKTRQRGLSRCCNDCLEMGPIYTGKINTLKIDDEFVKSLNQEDEYPPWHYDTNEFKFGNEPKMEVLLNKFKAVRAHYEPKSIKTKLDYTELLKISNKLK